MRYAAFFYAGDMGETGYISVILVTACIGSALTAGHFGKEPQSNQRALAFDLDLRRPVKHAGRNSTGIWGVDRKSVV